MPIEATPDGNGPDVVLLHGLGATRYSWHKTVEVLRSSFRTHALDLATFGKSETPPGFGCSMAEHADLVIDYLQQKEISRLHLVGHSMGGGVACYLVSKLLEDSDIGITVDRLVLVSAAVYPAPGMRLFFQNLRTRINELKLLPPESIAKLFLEAAYDKSHDPRPEYVKAYAENFRSPSDLENFISHGENLNLVAELEARYGSLTPETSVIWGANDKLLSPAFATNISKALPKAKLHLPLLQCGHIPHEELPDETNSLIKSSLSG